jgi:predicted RNA-binding Zn-ribbon protein involved in translation (DUF1610 family)
MASVVQLLPSITATLFACPQCGQAMHLKSVEPHPTSGKEDHKFECRECGLPRTYTLKLN